MQWLLTIFMSQMIWHQMLDVNKFFWCLTMIVDLSNKSFSSKKDKQDSFFQGTVPWLHHVYV